MLPFHTDARHGSAATTLYKRISEYELSTLINLLVSLSQLVLDDDERGPEADGEEGNGLGGESPLVVDVEWETLKIIE